MKIIWLSNKELTHGPTSSTGTWLHAMSLALSKCPHIELFNIAIGNGVKKIVRRDCGKIKQWIVPITRLKNGLPPKNIISGICDVIDTISPDLVHIWGVECFWGLLSARGYIKYPVLLEIQGLRYTCADAYYGGMSIREILLSVRLIDLVVFHRRIDRQKSMHAVWGKYEQEILSYHKYISTQSDWVRAMIKPYCQKDVEIFRTKMAIRDNFMKSQPWQCHTVKGQIQLLSIVSMATPYKGVHIVLKAVALLKKVYPMLKLKLVGHYMQNGWDIHKIGYVKFIERLIKKLELEDNVIFTGPLSEKELELEMQKSNVVIHSSFVESYSLSLAESMAVGVPCVVAYAGAMPELVNYGEYGLMYSPSDYHMCASQIFNLLNNEALCIKLSSLSRTRANARNDIGQVIDRQLNIYDVIIQENAQ